MEQPTQRIAVHCSHLAIDLDKVYSMVASNETTRSAYHRKFFDVAGSSFESSELHSDSWTAYPYGDVLYLRETNKSAVRKEVFLFCFGVVVFWNWETESAEKSFLRLLSPFSSLTLTEEVQGCASDDIEYYFGDTFAVRNDVVELSSESSDERLAVSYAFSQSSLLSVFEARVDEIIARNEHIPVELAKHGKIHMSQTAISKEMGRLFMERNSINLESDILGTPDHFWEDDVWEPVYRTVSNYLEQEDRHDILNKRLDCVRELLDVLSTQSENQHASSLEMIIIWLIVSEVVVAIVWNVLIKDILGYFQHCK